MGKYLWGDDPMSPVMVVAGVIWGALINTIGVWIQGGKDGYIDDSGVVLTRKDLKPMMVFTILWAVLHMMNHFISVVLALVMPNHPKAAAHIASRMAGNLDEWAYLWIILVWMYAMFFNYQLGYTFGFLWLFHRVSYGIYYAWYGRFTMFVELSTQPQYQLYYTFIWVMLADLAGDYNFIKEVCDVHPVLMFPTFLLFHFTTMPVVLGLGAGWGSYFASKCAEEGGTKLDDLPKDTEES